MKDTKLEEKIQLNDIIKYLSEKDTFKNSQYKHTKMNAITSSVSTIVSHPFNVMFIKSLHNCKLSFNSKVLFKGIGSELLLNVSLSSFYGFLMDK